MSKSHFRAALVWCGDIIFMFFTSIPVSHRLGEAILNAPDKEKDELCWKFIKSKQSELTNVMLTSALVASMTPALFAWTWFPVPPWTAKAAILTGLLHSLMALAAATQQAIALSRVSSHPKYQELVLTMLGKGSTSYCRFWIDFAWQIPPLLQGNSILFILGGLCISVYSAAVRAHHWGTEEKIAVCFTVSFAFTLACYTATWICIEHVMQRKLATLSHGQTIDRAVTASR